MEQRIIRAFQYGIGYNDLKKWQTRHGNKGLAMFVIFDMRDDSTVAYVDTMEKVAKILANNANYAWQPAD